MNTSIRREKSAQAEIRLADAASTHGEALTQGFANLAARTFVNQFELPLIVADRSGLVLWSTESARRHLRPPLPVFLNGTRICFADPTVNETVASHLALLSEERWQILCGEVSSSRWALISGWVETVRGERVNVLGVRTANPLRSCEDSGLARQFHLTKAECAVLDRFGRMQSPKEIAQDMTITVHTVRSHLKRVHAKLGVSSSTRLLQIVRAYCDA